MTTVTLTDEQARALATLVTERWNAINADHWDALERHDEARMLDIEAEMDVLRPLLSTLNLP